MNETQEDRQLPAYVLAFGKAQTPEDALAIAVRTRKEIADFITQRDAPATQARMDTFTQQQAADWAAEDERTRGMSDLERRLTP